MTTLSRKLTARRVAEFLDGAWETVLVTGSVVTPVDPGTYTLSLTNLRATVLVGDDQATGYWMVEPAGVGTITNLTIEVLPAQPPAEFWWRLPFVEPVDHPIEAGTRFPSSIPPAIRIATGVPVTPWAITLSPDAVDKS